MVLENSEKQSTFSVKMVKDTSIIMEVYQYVRICCTFVASSLDHLLTVDALPLKICEFIVATC